MNTIWHSDQCVECESTGQNCRAHSIPGSPGRSIYDVPQLTPSCRGNLHGRCSGKMRDRTPCECPHHTEARSKA
jgi:hypothetical protein